MHKRAIRTVLAVAVAIPLAFLSVAPASAEPGDIRAEFTATPNPGGSNTVTGTFTATGDNLPGYCFMNGREGNGNTLLGQASTPGGVPVITITDTDVPDNTYTVEWFCDSPTGGSGFDGTEYWLGVGYQQSSILVVGPAEPGCTGSVCLPTGSFGF